MNEYQNRLKFLIDRSNYLYQKYKLDPIYINALLIKSVNKKIIDLLLSKGYLFKKNYEVNEILNHFEIWYYQFIEHEKSNNLLTDKFTFQRINQATTYPRKAIEKLIKHK